MADEPWQRLAALIRSRREERRMSQRELATAADTTDRLVSALERAERTTYKPATLRLVSQALGWTPDSVERILAGGTPVAANERDELTIDEKLDRIETMIAELRELLQRPVS